MAMDTLLPLQAFVSKHVPNPVAQVQVTFPLDSICQFAVRDRFVVAGRFDNALK
jgi:hypothetical protein